MTTRLYLINPLSDFPTYFSAEVYAGTGHEGATFIADLATPTLAALAPGDFEVRVCDENISPVDFDAPVDFVGITGKITQWTRMEAIAREFQRRGKTVLIGGPYASLCPDLVRPHCDVLVRGEIEEIAGDLFADLRERRPKPEYLGGRPDLGLCPVPRWSAYPNHRALMGVVQTSRGCPFECEFCDVIQYLGRKQRHKPVSHVLAELETVYEAGYNTIFLSDDNFTVHRSRTKELLRALRHWNTHRENGRCAFLTQVSIDAARDEELLELCATAGLTQVFIGIETPNPDSLREAKKRQNLHGDLIEQVQRFLDHGIAVTAGLIVGFDSDGPDIFERQYEFAMSSPIPVFSLGALVAPAATPLYDRMAREGRLIPQESEVAGAPWSTNIVPRRMTREELLRGTAWLCRKLYEPAAFGERLCNLIDRLGRRRDPRYEENSQTGAFRAVDFDSLRLISAVSTLGEEEATMWARVGDRLERKPEAAEFASRLLLQYAQIRYMFERGQLWEPRISAAPPVAAAAVPAA